MNAPGQNPGSFGTPKEKAPKNRGLRSGGAGNRTLGQAGRKRTQTDPNRRKRTTNRRVEQEDAPVCDRDATRCVRFGVPSVPSDHQCERGDLVANCDRHRSGPRGRLNQRPLAPQSCAHHQSMSADSSNPSQPERKPESARPMLMLHFAGFRPPFSAPVMQGSVTVSAYALLTVREAAARLRCSAATVYGLCARAELVHLRISTNAIRIREGDLSAFIRQRLGVARRNACGRGASACKGAERPIGR
jgi:excisionase family DNA binding protein